MIIDKLNDEITSLDNQISAIRARSSEEIARLETKKAALVAARSAITPDLVLALTRLQRAGVLKDL